MVIWVRALAALVAAAAASAAGGGPEHNFAGKNTFSPTGRWCSRSTWTPWWRAARPASGCAARTVSPCASLAPKRRSRRPAAATAAAAAADDDGDKDDGEGRQRRRRLRRRLLLLLLLLLLLRRLLLFLAFVEASRLPHRHARGRGRGGAVGGRAAIDGVACAACARHRRRYGEAISGSSSRCSSRSTRHEPQLGTRSLANALLVATVETPLEGYEPYRPRHDHNRRRRRGGAYQPHQRPAPPPCGAKGSSVDRPDGTFFGCPRRRGQRSHRRSLPLPPPPPSSSSSSSSSSSLSSSSPPWGDDAEDSLSLWSEGRLEAGQASEVLAALLARSARNATLAGDGGDGGNDDEDGDDEDIAGSDSADGEEALASKAFAFDFGVLEAEEKEEDKERASER